MMKRITFLLLVFILPLSFLSQSEAVSKFAEKADGYNLYLYQSLIRVLNAERNDDFNKLIKDLDYLKFIMTDSIGSQSLQWYTELEKGLNSEGFEELITYEDKDYKAKVYSNDSDDEASNWIVIFNLGQISGLFEMKGTVDMKYMNSLSTLNVSKLKDLFPMMEKFDIDMKDDFEND